MLTIRAALLSLALLSSARFGSLTVTRSSLLGFTISDVGHGLSLDEAASALAAFESRVRGAVARAVTSLQANYGLTGKAHVAFGVSRSRGVPCARVDVTLVGAVSGRDRAEAIGRVILCLRDVGLEAHQSGDLGATVFGGAS